jgi:regulatory protein
MENNFHELLLKAERFCAYQERCSYEVKQKLRELGADETEIEKIIVSLQEDDFQNDERFALLFASGKFRIKRWGKNKIRAELRMKKIPDAFIKKGLDAINKEEYIKTIEHLIKKKEREVKSKNAKDKNQKIGMFLLSKGFESELIWKSLKQVQD